MNEKEMNALFKPCPFCGSGNVSMSEEEWSCRTENYISCGDCGNRSEGEDWRSNNLYEKLLKKWNLRVMEKKASHQAREDERRKFASFMKPGINKVLDTVKFNEKTKNLELEFREELKKGDKNG